MNGLMLPEIALFFCDMMLRLLMDRRVTMLHNRRKVIQSHDWTGHLADLLG